MTNHQVQTNLPPIAKGVNQNSNNNDKFNNIDNINYDVPQSQNSTKHSGSIQSSQNRSLEFHRQNKQNRQSFQQQDTQSNKIIQKVKPNNSQKIQNDASNLSSKYNTQSQEFYRDDDIQFSREQSKEDYQEFIEIKQNGDLHYYDQKNQKVSNAKDKQLKQPFVPYKFRKSSNPSVNTNSLDQNNFYYNSKGYLQNESNIYAADFIINISEGEVSKEEYRDPILNVEKHRKDFGINIAQKMNRFYNIKALTNKSQQLQLAFDNANNLFIVDQRDENYLSQTVMNLNIDMSTRKHQSQNILQQIIQEKRNSINQIEGLSHSITTNGKESLLSELSKKSHLKAQLQMQSQSNMIKPKYMLYHNINSRQISPKSNKNTIINSPISQYSNQNNLNNNFPKNNNNDFSGSAQYKNNSNQVVMSRNNSNHLTPTSPISQFDRFANKKPEIPLVNTRKALFKYTNSKKQVKWNTEGSLVRSQNFKNQSDFSQENLKTTTETACFSRLSDLFHNQQLNTYSSTNKNQPLFSKQTQQGKPYFQQGINFSESLKTWKVKQFNDDFNKISKELKKSYYRGQLNNKFDSKNQTAYFTTNGMYGFFCSKTEEANRKSEQPNQEKPKSQEAQNIDINSLNKQPITMQNQQTDVKTPRKEQSYNNLKELFLQKMVEDEEQKQQSQSNQVQENIDAQGIKQNESAMQNDKQKKPNDSPKEIYQSETLKTSSSKNKIEMPKKDMNQIKSNLKNIQDLMIGNLKQPIHKQKNEIKGSNTAREIYQHTLEDDEITGWISRKKSDTLLQDRINFSSQSQSKTSIQFRKNLNPSIGNSVNNQQDYNKNLFNSSNGVNSFQLIPKSSQSNNNIQNSQNSIGVNTINNQQNNHKDPNLISKITEYGESYDYSLDNSNFIQNRMAGFMTRDKNDDDEDLKNYLHLQNIIPSLIK